MKISIAWGQGVRNLQPDGGLAGLKISPSSLRLALAKQALLQGRPLKAVAPLVGYKSSTALARAFQRQFGCGPRDWLVRQRQKPEPTDA